MTKIRECLSLSSLIIDFSMKIYDDFSNSYDIEKLKKYLNLNKKIGFIFNVGFILFKKERIERTKRINKNFK